MIDGGSLVGIIKSERQARDKERTDYAMDHAARPKALATISG
jgi:hypothetical protein